MVKKWRKTSGYMKHPPATKLHHMGPITATTELPSAPLMDPIAATTASCSRILRSSPEMFWKPNP
jgi:hypothetical protein